MCQGTPAFLACLMLSCRIESAPDRNLACFIMHSARHSTSLPTSLPHSVNHFPPSCRVLTIEQKSILQRFAVRDLLRLYEVPCQRKRLSHVSTIFQPALIPSLGQSFLHLPSLGLHMVCFRNGAAVDSHLVSSLHCCAHPVPFRGFTSRSRMRHAERYYYPIAPRPNT